jgi:hypothetical protein
MLVCVRVFRLSSVTSAPNTYQQKHTALPQQ